MSDNVVDKSESNHNNILLQEFYRLHQELSNKHYSTTDSEKNSKLNELEKAREKIKQEIIASDSSSDKSVLYTAITKFKKRNE